LRIGDYHARVMVSMMKQHLTIADVQAYGCLALENVSKFNVVPLRKAGAIELCEAVHNTFPAETFIRNCSSLLMHSLNNKTRGQEYNYTSLPPGSNAFTI
jgi:hypothetical protein